MTFHFGQWHNLKLVSLLITLVTVVTVISVDVKPQKERYTPDYSIYHNLSSIGMTVDKYVKTYPNLIRQHSSFISKQGRSQHVLEITNFTKAQENDPNHNPVKILFSFGEHAREFLPVETLFHILKVVTQQGHTGSVQKIDLNKLHVFVIVMANPDGRHYVETSQNYCWRGTSTGVDINRNFDWEFGGKGSSSDKNDEEYRGHHVFSEPETKVFVELTEKVKFDAFVSLHSGIRQIYIPYADSRSAQLGREPANLSAMVALAKTLASSTRAGYQYGRASSLNEYSADGTVFDYMAGRRKIPFSYAIELWGPDNYTGNSCFDLFNPPNDKLQTVIEEIFPLYTTLFDQLVQWKVATAGSSVGQGSIVHSPDHPSLAISGRHTVDAKNEVPSLTFGFTLLCVLVLLTALVGLHGKYPVCRRMVQRRRIVSLRSLSTTFSTSVFRT